MTRYVLAPIIGLLVLALAVLAQATPPTTPFTGTWIGQDTAPPDGDGSTVHLVINGGTNATIQFIDDFGTVCVNEGSSVTEFTSRLTGRVNGSTLNATFRSARCGPVVVRFLLGQSFTLQLDDGGTPTPPMTRCSTAMFCGDVLSRNQRTANGREDVGARPTDRLGGQPREGASAG